MRSGLRVRVALMLALAFCLSAAAYAGDDTQRCYCSAQAGDYQIVLNNQSEAVVRVWVSNSCRRSGFVLVTVVAPAPDGSLLQSSYPLYLPGRSTRPVDIEFGSEIAFVSKLFVTPLGR